SPSASMPPADHAMKPRMLCVIGAGNLGLAQAGHLAAQGHSVRLFNRKPDRLEGLGPSRRIQLGGALTAEGRLPLATTELAVAVEGAEILFVDIAATGHAALAAALAPLLEGSRAWDPLVVLHPGQTFASLHFARALRAAGCSRAVRLCEL